MLQEVISKCQKPIVRICKILACIFYVCLLLLLSTTFDVYFSLWNAISFATIFIALPFLVFICLRKIRGIRWYILSSVIVSVPFLILIYCNGLVYVNNNFETYLSDDTDFVKNSESVLPSKNSLREEQIVFFEYLSYLDKDFEMYRFAVNYEDMTFNEEKERLQTQYDENTSKMFEKNTALSDDDFYFDGVRYSCYTFCINGIDFAMAYNLCEETNTISYIFFKDRACLSTMDAGVALQIFYKDGQFGSSKHAVSKVWSYSKY